MLEEQRQQTAGAPAGSPNLPRSQSHSGQEDTNEGGVTCPSHCGCTPTCDSGFRLMEGPPAFFLSSNPSAQQLEAFKAFAASAMKIRQEIMGDEAEVEKYRESQKASVSPNRTKSLLNRRMGRTERSAKTAAADEAAGAVSDEAAQAAEAADAASPPSLPVRDAYPEVPELAGSGRLLRYLVGFDFDVSAASEAYRRHVKWRKEVGLDAKRRRAVVESLLFPMRPEAAPRHAEVTRYFPTNPALRQDVGPLPSKGSCAAAAAATAAASATGDGDSLLRAMTDEALNAVLLDKHGNIISIERPGQLDVNGLFAAVSEAEFLRWHTYILEFRCMLLDVLSRKLNRMVRMTSIIDLQGLSARILNRRALNLLKRTISAASENYPESIGAMFFINTPRTFSTLWSVMRGWLRERTINKITLLGSDTETILVKHIGGYALPPSLGGSCTSELGDVPRREEDREIDLGPGSMVLTVGARKCNQAVELVPKKSVAQWIWVAEDFDVGFSAIWRNQSGLEKVIEEHRKYPARKRVSGVFSAEQDGSLILAFDNTWGLISARRVRYKIEIMPALTAGVPARNRAASSSLL